MSIGVVPNMHASPIRHVLFDADGVLQIVPGGWHTAVAQHLGDRASDFIGRVRIDEHSTLTGTGDFVGRLTATLADFGVADPVEVVYRDLWNRIELIAESFVLVEALRTNGYGVHLGTNQHEQRGTYMRTVLGYDDIFDTSCYSYELGHAKPEPTFFLEAARRIGAEPLAILFVDDNFTNVDSAREIGMQAVHWDVEHGHAVLVEALSEHGVDARIGAD